MYYTLPIGNAPPLVVIDLPDISGDEIAAVSCGRVGRVSRGGFPCDCAASTPQGQGRHLVVHEVGRKSVDDMTQIYNQWTAV